MRIFIALLFFVIAQFAFAQTTLTVASFPNNGDLIRGVNDQQTGRFTLVSSTGATWNSARIQFSKVVSSPWSPADIENYFKNVRIKDGSSNTLATINPGSCVGATFTTTLWQCDVAMNFTLPPGGNGEWQVFVDIPLASPLAVLRQGFVATTNPNVQITGGGLVTVPNILVQGPMFSIKNPPPQPTMTLSASSPTGDILRGATNVLGGKFDLAVGAGSGSVSFSALRMTVEKSGGSAWTLGNVDNDFTQIGVFDGIGNIPIPKFNPSTCIDVLITSDRFECTVPVTYSMPVNSTSEFQVILNVGASGVANTLRVGFMPTLAPNTTLPGGGTFTFPAADVYGATRQLVLPPAPSMILAVGSPTTAIIKGTNDHTLVQATVEMSAGIGSATVNSVKFMVTGEGTSWTLGNIDNDFVQIGVYDDLSGTVVAQANPSGCTVVSVTIWECIVPTMYTMSAGETRTWNMVLDIPLGATATSLQGSFEVGSANVSLSGGGTASLPTARVIGAVRLISDPPPQDEIFLNGFEG